MEGERSRRIALVTTDLAAINEVDRDLPVIIAAFERLGIEALPVRWRETTPDSLCEFDAVVLRSPWDYPEHFDHFMGWLAQVASNVPLFNNGTTIRWNVDKSYLVVLASCGIPVVPTTVADTIADVKTAVNQYARTHRDVVIKPNISVGSRDTGLFSVNDPQVLSLAAQVIAQGKRVIVQPAIASVAEHGEREVICIDGKFSHAVTKGPILEHGGGMIGDCYTEVINPTRATPDEIALAEEVVRTVANLVAGHMPADQNPIPLYARIDLVATPDGPLVLEAELIEPSLFCDTMPGSAAAFAEALAHRLKPRSAK